MGVGLRGCGRCGWVCWFFLGGEDVENCGGESGVNLVLLADVVNRKRYVKINTGELKGESIRDFPVVDKLIRWDMS